MTEAIRIHDAAKAHNVPVWCGGMLESGIAAYTTFTCRRWRTSSSWRRFCFEAILEEDIIDPEVLVSPQGTIRVPPTFPAPASN